MNHVEIRAKFLDNHSLNVCTVSRTAQLCSFYCLILYIAHVFHNLTSRNYCVSSTRPYDLARHVSQLLIKAIHYCLYIKSAMCAWPPTWPTCLAACLRGRRPTCLGQREASHRGGCGSLLLFSLLLLHWRIHEYKYGQSLHCFLDMSMYIYHFFIKSM